MKIFWFVIQLLLLIIFISCSHHKVQEYYENGKMKSELSYNKSEVLDGLCKYYYPEGALSEEMIYEEGILKQYRKYNRSGSINFEAQMEGDLKNGLSREYLENGVLRVESVYSLDRLIGYYRFDSVGTMVYWYKELKVDSLPEFRDEFIKIINVTDTGFFIQATVPDIPPFQVIPFMARGKGRVIDGSKSLWFLESDLPIDSLLKIGVRVALDEDNRQVLGWREVRLSDFIK